ncbi:hypothetical protein [Natrarchaeobius chitinivorans]|nr:hypothetical protein [Natrarchaeobius chitinivorans]
MSAELFTHPAGSKCLHCGAHVTGRSAESLVTTSTPLAVEASAIATDV